MMQEVQAWQSVLEEIGQDLAGADSARFPVLTEDFGAPEVEAEALREGAGWVPIAGYERLALRGERARETLQGQVTLDLSDLKNGRGGYAFQLDRKGRLVSDMILRIGSPLQVSETAGDGEISWLASAERQAVLKNKLAAVAMLADCDLVAEEDEKLRWLVAGSGAQEDVTQRLGLDRQDLDRLTEAPYEFQRLQDDLVVQSLPDLGVPCFLLESSRAGAKKILELSLQGDSESRPRLCGRLAYDALRIAKGTPLWGVELGEANLPAECHAEHAISYDKGCYVGQETVARMKTYGGPNKLLRGLRSENAPKIGARIQDESGKEIGTITSSAPSGRDSKHLSLAFVKRSAFAPGTAVSIEGQESVVEELPFA